jgi:hypothetical protein
MKYKYTWTAEEIQEAYRMWREAKVGMREKEWSYYLDRRDGYVHGHHWAKHTKQYGLSDDRKSFVVGLEGKE